MNITEGKMLPRVVCAANRCRETGRIAIGIRHFCPIMRANMDAMPGPKWASSEQGFVDQGGKFLTREEALRIAKEAGQIVRRCGGDEFKLFSENLYQFAVLGGW